MRYLTMLRVLVYCCVALPAGAQTRFAAPSTFAGVKVKNHATLYVTETSNLETKGRLVSLTDQAITLQLKNAIWTFTPDEVVLIERKGDSLKNGAIAGAVIAGVCLLTCAQGVSS